MKKFKILVDLKTALNNGYCGIANENRLVFKMLSGVPAVKTTGVLFSQHPSSVFSGYTQSNPQEMIAQANRFFHEALGHEPLLRTRILRNLKLASFLAFKKRRFDLFSIDPLFGDAIWRNVFRQSLGAGDREKVLQNDFCFSDLTAMHMRVGSYFRRNALLNTAGHDAVLFLEPSTVSVSPGTVKLVRYHDAIPVTEPDFSQSIYSHRSINAMRICAQDSWFVCNSGPSRDTLLRLHPEAEARTVVIPCAIASHHIRVNDTNILKQILRTRLASTIVPAEQLDAARSNIDNGVDYILNLAALDPKKNHVTLINAWEKMNYHHQRKTRLVIAANRGWLSQEAEDKMRPHIQQGNIIHIDNVTTEELPYLFSHARAFVFPSYAEGFGLPPLEAMQCGCPVIASDIPAHRWVLGDAALYANPYDADALTAAMARLVHAADADEQGAELANRGLQRVRLYSVDALTEQWLELIERVKPAATTK